MATISMVTWGIKCARARARRAQAQILSSGLNDSLLEFPVPSFHGSND